MANAGTFNCTATNTLYAMASDNVVQGPVRVKARAGNTGAIRIGDSTLTTVANGYQLDKGEHVDLDWVNNMNQVYAMAATANDKVDWIVLVAFT